MFISGFPQASVQTPAAVFGESGVLHQRRRGAEEEASARGANGVRRVQKHVEGGLCAPDLLSLLQTHMLSSVISLVANENVFTVSWERRQLTPLPPVGGFKP